ncbi:OB-fold protein [Hyunsoonleella sp. 2307UL5-6]|uniref:OB-fold protein n=1 Tax=Hyunsoonleella sp. 2307UL5-6 TaxID=3384768 RepID=UPI0039BD03A6
MKAYIRNNILFICALFCVLSLIIGLYYATNTSSNSNTHHLKTYKQLSSHTLLDEYNKETYAKLIEKAIEIDGIIKKIQYKNSIYTLYVSYENGESYVLCELQKDQNDKIAHLKVGDKIAVKGILKGKLLDIVLLNCIII